MTTDFSKEDVKCALTGDPAAEYWVFHPVHGQETESPDLLAERIRTLAPAGDFCLVSISVPDWFGALSPWPTGTAIGDQPFTGGGRETLRVLETNLIPGLRAQYGAEHRCVLAGYSLAGLFALWSAYETDCFSGVAAVSPSLWFPGWGEYAAARRPHADAVYLSLGDREAKSRNPVIATVGDAVWAQNCLLRTQDVCCTLEWNPGGHFRESEMRMAKGIAWVLAELSVPRKNTVGTP